METTTNFTDDVDAYRRSPAAFSNEHPYPVFIHVGDIDVPSAMAFKTHTMLGRETAEYSRPDLDALLIEDAKKDGTGINDPVNFREVYAVRKRGDGVFQDRIGIGRARSADVPLRYPGISKYHAYLTQQQDGSLVLTDAGSKNGTVVDGQRLPKDSSAPVKDWTRVEFGGERFVFFSQDGYLRLLQKLAASGTFATG